MYVTNSGNNTVSMCALDPDSGGALTGCSVTASGFNEPYDIEINSGHAYVTNNNGNTVTLCNVTAGTGALDCAVTPSGVNFNNEPTTGIVVAANGLAFISSYMPSGGNVYACPVDSTTGELACSVPPSPTGGQYYEPKGMAERAPYLYIVNFGRPSENVADVSVCLNNGAGLSSCSEAVAVTFNPGPITYTFDAPQALVFFGDYALVTSSGGNAVVLCTMNSDAPALLSDCTVTASGFNVPADIVIVSPS